MPLLSIARIFTTLLSLALLGTAGYLIWSWAEGEWIQRPGGLSEHVREDWRLWTGLGLLAWSFLGRIVLLPLLARRDTRPPTRPERSQGRTVTGYSGATLYVEEHGPAGAPTIIFTHGWGMDSTLWHYAKRDLADRFRIVLWDLPGLGKSRAAPGGVKLTAFAADLAALMEASGRRRHVLVGHSIGGMTIQTLVKEHPELLDRVAGIVLLNTTHTNPLRTMILSKPLRALQKPVIEPLMHLTRWLHPLVWLSKWQSYLSGSAHLAHRLGFGRYVTRSQLDHVTLLSTRNPPAIEAQGNLAMMNWDATGAMGRTRIPVLAIGGDMDIVTKLEASRAIVQDSPRGRLEVVEGANHLGPVECADLYNELIANFTLSVQPAVSADGRPSRAVERETFASPDDYESPFPDLPTNTAH